VINMEVFLTISLTFKDNAFWTFKFPLPEKCFTKMLVTLVLIEKATLNFTDRKLSKGLWFGMPHIIQYGILTFWPEHSNMTLWCHEMLPVAVLIWHSITCKRYEQEFLITYKHGIQICPPCTSKQWTYIVINYDIPGSCENSSVVL